MVIIRFADAESKRKTLAFLAGRFRFTTWSTGDMLVPEAALAYLALEGIRFQVEGPASYEQAIPPLRDLAAPQV